LSGSSRTAAESGLTDGARAVLDTLRSRGASFARDLALACDGDETAVPSALAELASAGLVTSDGFAGVRAIIGAAAGRTTLLRTLQAAGRWSAIDTPDLAPDSLNEAQAPALLRRYGVVFRRVAVRETNAAPWRDLTRVYRRLEARGEIRGGRFVAGMAGEQFALPDAVERLREIRRTPSTGRLLAISGADPLNLSGVVTSGERIRAVEANRIVYRDGIAVAALEGDFMRPLAALDPAVTADVATTLTGRRMSPIAAGFVGRST
jgi:ATP-dependent Lhr-like helicase